MNIKSFFSVIDKHHLYRFKDLGKYKYVKKTVISDHSHKVNSSISRLQDKSSEVIENGIHNNSRIRHLSNPTTKSDSSLFIAIYSTPPNIKPTSNQQGSMLLFNNNNYQEVMSSNKTSLTDEISDLIIYEGLSFNLDKKQGSRRY